jgi:hypothetical protein
VRSKAVSFVIGEEFTVAVRAPEESRWFVFQINRANTNFVIQTRGNLDTMLSLYDSVGNKIAEDDDSGGVYNALISEILGAGTYYIEMKIFGSTTGRFTVLSGIR